ncbi:DUF819 domain-containing protein [Suipraeoptans intestinalis]|uniref:DUF819 domain-containing protein n=1 Tax=Suipraeoptans intestinalis TaxID=2606628 RepID=A0A6N7USY6_9FIRM|nr:DUF819 family protein [Suipraeoptans intestinalis]MDD7770599.1 DUF819 family protein [Suipraeoptans intestinalis]MDY3121190.1 DUF819 family protein [Suipraeoptans intestinalis]MSR93934.1 DUF819 domain-containing protein [Suipraeoptans intestinalis]
MWGHIFDLNNPLVGAENTWMLWTICVLGAAIAIYLEQKYEWAAKLTGAIIALVLAIVLSNFGIIPMDAPTWDNVWGFVVPLAIPLLLLQCDMRKIGKEAGRILIIFLFGSVGTACGALLAYAALHKFIPELAGLAGVFTGTYIGGTVNFAALGAAFDVSGEMISAATVADNLLMALYFFALIAIPSIGFFRKHFKHPYVDAVEASSAHADKNQTNAAAFWGRKEISLKDIALGAATAFTIVTLSDIIATIFASIIPTGNAFLGILNTLMGNKYLWITTIAMCCATFAPGFFGEIKGTNELGTFLIYIFFFVIGVPASIVMIVKNSPLLLVFAAIVVFVNMLFSFVAGKLLKFNLEDIILASNANIGGPTTAAAMAVSKGWTDLIGPIVLVGTLGYVLGTYFGLIVGSILGL